MPRVVHFELPADQPERAAEFYRSVFGWEIMKWGPVNYWLIKTGPETEPGIDGAIAKREDRTGTVNTISVSSLDDCVKRITAAGGELIGPKRAIPGIGYHVYCRDPEGNVIGVLQPDPGAA